MALKIVTGGTTGAADGTLVSSSNKIVFTALDTAVDCHIRADDDTYSADASFSMPSDGAVQVSFDGGSTWKAFGTNPNSYGVDIGDLNVAIKLRQHDAAAASTGTFQTDATTTAATAAPNVSALTVTAGNAQNVLTWSDVANDSGYLIETSANGTTGWSTVTTTAANATTYTHTGLTNGTAYYYRITAVGTGRYKNATTPATGNGTPAALSLIKADAFGGTSGTSLATYDSTWVRTGGTDGAYPVKISAAGRAYQDSLSGTGYYTDYDYNHAFTVGYVEIDLVPIGTGTNGGSHYWLLRKQADGGNPYQAYAFYIDNGHDGTAGNVQVYKYKSGATTTYYDNTGSALTVSTKFRFGVGVGAANEVKLEKWNGSSWTTVYSGVDASSPITGAGKLGLEIASRNGVSGGLHFDNMNLYGDA